MTSLGNYLISRLNVMRHYGLTYVCCFSSWFTHHHYSSLCKSVSFLVFIFWKIKNRFWGREVGLLFTYETHGKHKWHPFWETKEVHPSLKFQTDTGFGIPQNVVNTSSTNQNSNSFNVQSSVFSCVVKSQYPPYLVFWLTQLAPPERFTVCFPSTWGSLSNS